MKAKITRTDWKKKYENEVESHKRTAEHFSQSLKDFDNRLETHKKEFIRFNRVANILMVIIALMFLFVLFLCVLRVQMEKTAHITDIHNMYMQLNECEQQFVNYQVEVINTHRVNPDYTFFDCCYPDCSPLSSNNDAVCQCYFDVECDSTTINESSSSGGN